MSARMALSFDRQCELSGLPVPVAEHRFAAPRRWRFDYAFRDERIAVEIEGGAFIQGRHTRGVGFINDLSKYNAATMLGWKVLRFTPQQVRDGEALKAVEALLKAVAGDGVSPSADVQDTEV